MEVKMKRALSSCLLILLGFAVFAQPASAQTTKFAYAATATCLNSSSGFNSKLEPNIAGTAWTETFHGVGSGDVANPSTAKEYMISVLGAVPGSQPSIAPAANAYTNTIIADLTGPNSDGSYTLTATSWHGSVTAGPNKGLTYLVTNQSGVYALKVWLGNNGVNVEATEPSPVVQKVTLSNNITFERICATSAVTTSPLK
jgi:hypothetical protein